MNYSMQKLLSIILLGALLVAQSCKEDEAIPAKTLITGTIDIENAEVWETWADSGEVQLTLFPAFSLDPLAGWGEIPDNFFGPGVPGGTYAVGAPYNSQNPLVFDFESGKTSYNYELEVEAGDYSALAIGFRHNGVNDPNLKTATLGVHWEMPDSVSHGVVIKLSNPAGGFIPVFNYPAPSAFSVQEGETKVLNFSIDFDFVNQWYQ
jgi:hypothetical protein